MTSSADTPRRRRPRVELYERIVTAIDDGTFPPGSQLPSEPALAARLGVSRPALREVLILLQEDGVITRRHGVGSRVNRTRHTPGLERLLPVEELLGTDAVECRRLQVQHDQPTDFTGFHLHLSPGEPTWFWESLFLVGGAAACLSQEWVAEAAVRETLGGPVADAVTGGKTPGGVGSMLAALLAAADDAELHCRSTIGATTLGTARGRAMDRPAPSPALVLVQTVSAGARPVLVAKHVLPAGAPLLQLTPRR